jgi:hypothetical protein
MDKQQAAETVKAALEAKAQQHEPAEKPEEQSRREFLSKLLGLGKDENNGEESR